jgi:dTDP-glucose pyrophosphorylase
VPELEAIDPAATTWLLASTALVLLMTPGLAIFYGPGLGTSPSRFRDVDGGAIFAYWVANPSAYGVIEFSDDGTVCRWRRSRPP